MMESILLLLQMLLPAPRLQAPFVDTRWDLQRWYRYNCSNLNFFTSQPRNFSYAGFIVNVLVAVIFRDWFRSIGTRGLIVYTSIYLLGKPISNFILSHSILFYLPKVTETATIVSKTGSHAENKKIIKEYIYANLGHRNRIRLLLLHRGTYAKELSGDLIEASADTTFQYEALSYTWNSPLGATSTSAQKESSSQYYIRLRGKRLIITENCDAALRRIRSRFCGKLLWVDSICINQENEEGEKEQQIELMYHIYRGATKVLIWLGPSRLEFEIAFKYLLCMSQWLFLTNTLREWVWGLILGLAIRRGHDGFILDIVSRSWFTRVWTLQETAFPQGGSVFFLANSGQINYDWIQTALSHVATLSFLKQRYTMNHHNSVIALMLRQRMRLQIIYGGLGETEKDPNWASWIMRTTMACDATKPHDKVYSLFTYFRQRKFIVSQPDYGITISQVYRDVTTAILRKEKSLNLFTVVTSLSHNLHGVPSWVPDFSQIYTPRLAMYGGFCATLNSTCPEEGIRVVDHPVRVEKYLVCEGTVVDTIKERSPLLTWPLDVSRRVMDGPFVNLESHFVETVRAFQDWLALALSQRTSQYSSSNDRMDSWTAVRKTFLYQEMPYHDMEMFALWFELIISKDPRFFGCSKLDLDEMLKPAREDPELRDKFFDNPELVHLTEIDEWKILCAAKTHPATREIHHHIWMMSLNCTFFVTESGYMGTAPASIQKGDRIALMPGVNQPMVLREKGMVEECDSYTVVCAAYVHGMMAGEIWPEQSGKMKVIILE